jgi:type I pantothenate kinase
LSTTPAFSSDGLIPPDEVAAIYAPFSRLLRRQVRKGTTYLIGVAGAVSVGKSTTAKLLRDLLADDLEVGLISTDGFLFPNSQLAALGLSARKGCPESYDVARLVRFLHELKSGQPDVSAPVYSHRTYDVVAGEEVVLHSPDVVIVEGVNILDTPFDLDYSVYIDADEGDIEQWYVRRFVALCERAGTDPGSFYSHFAGMSAEEIERLAERVWRDINGPNLRASVLPTRGRADLILEKGPDHAVRRIRVRDR